MIPTEPREKGIPAGLKLPKLALDIVNSRPRFIGNPYVFASKNGHATATLFSGTYKRTSTRSVALSWSYTT